MRVVSTFSVEGVLTVNTRMRIRCFLSACCLLVWLEPRSPSCQEHKKIYSQRSVALNKIAFLLPTCCPVVWKHFLSTLNHQTT